MSCDDGLAETVGDQCVAGGCIGTTWIPECQADADCGDDDVCNGQEQCAADGTCRAGAAPLCAGSTQCTESACDPSLGCVALPRAEGTSCDDGRSETLDDQCTGGVCQGRVHELSVTGIYPHVVRPGTAHIEIRGSGFESGLVLRFEFGKGPTPRVESLIVIDTQTLAAQIRVRSQGPPKPRLWDVVLTGPQGAEVRLLDGLRVDP
jgi:hypothetical protein